MALSVKYNLSLIHIYLSPLIGSWIAIVVITPIGIFLSYKAATDSVIFDMEVYKRFFNKLIRRKTETLQP